jgi:hypothetical protein
LRSDDSQRPRSEIAQRIEPIRTKLARPVPQNTDAPTKLSA